MRRTTRARPRAGALVALAAAVALVVGGCSDTSSTTGGGAADTAGGGDAASASPSPSPSTFTGAGTGPNPVIADDFPDPDVLEVDGVYYAYGTNGNLRNIRAARSTDLVEWETLPDVLPSLPSWVIPGKTWAPEVTEVEPGRYALYFTATNFRPSLQCVGVAVASSPEGPFDVVGDAMLVCPPDEGGAIDASTFRTADGTLHLLWKNDGNCCGLDTWLQTAPLTPDGTALAGPAVKLLKQDQEWEGDLVEAPTVVERDGRLVMLYSANSYGGDQYAIGWASAPALEGPWTKAPEPLLTTDATDRAYIGPGGQDVVVGPDGEDLLVFHSWYDDVSYRGVNVLPLDWEAGEPVVRLEPDEG
ncbi:glycoside hydrolase family 43 protein [Cellulomonas marina]|uniref:Glycosyl hydrolases family 43 n=1 Tax=Cellulomonas marina TaxID=988821 RepID=A0A1I0Y3A4_9CELL|nr:glycoside hydrolase family 43 protein [Cellulomonas marina]GIG28410.1 glycoside hydrolase [Cellulomonas marina]SFB06918.1 Glycosyl hydrolases family 43 [Cellulomonas marina]